MYVNALGTEITRSFKILKTTINCFQHRRKKNYKAHFLRKQPNTK